MGTYSLNVSGIESWVEQSGSYLIENSSGTLYHDALAGLGVTIS